MLSDIPIASRSRWNMAAASRNLALLTSKAVIQGYVGVTTVDWKNQVIVSQR